MTKYIGVDSGKYKTKVAVYRPQSKDGEVVKKFSFETKIGDGDFRDDALNTNTFIAEYNGKTYKVGDGARTKAALNSSKRSEIHKVCTLLAIAMCASENEVDEFHVGIGMPVSEWIDVSKREEYKNYILPEGEIEVALKTRSDGERTVRKFKIVSRHAYPESMGALYAKGVAEQFEEGDIQAIIDIGNLNNNHTYWTDNQLDEVYSFSGDLGGNALITQLSQKLFPFVGPIDEKHIRTLLKRVENDKRYIDTFGKRDDKEATRIMNESKEVITSVIIEYFTNLKGKCEAMGWNLNLTNVIFIGGLIKYTANEAREVFGKNIIIPDESEYANVVGFLRVTCAKHLKCDILEQENVTKKSA